MPLYSIPYSGTPDSKHGAFVHFSFLLQTSVTPSIVSMNPVETYLKQLSESRASGAVVGETSRYVFLSNLLNEIGKSLKPKVRCFMGLSNQGAGMPDGGLFTADQFQNQSDLEPPKGQVPGRGVIEVKSPNDDISEIVRSEQVHKYLRRYGLALVTNYWDFVLVRRGIGGTEVALERFRLAANKNEFWDAASHPRKTADEIGPQFADYLKRVMLHAAPLFDPKDVAWFLASYAREAKARIEKADIPALANTRIALEDALGLKFQGPKGEHFFRSSLIQTLFYGIFSAWVLWCKQLKHGKGSSTFDWRTAAHYLRVPVLRKLFYQISEPGQLGELNLAEVLDWTTLALNRVVPSEFFSRFEEEHAVQYFYEPFLEEFDPDLRKELGVWYTPTEIVQYMVARVDTVLRTELGLKDGLADKRVYVLDPCCGTGAYLVEVLKRIAQTLSDKGADALLASDLKHAAMKRVFGFEILPAPFVIAHLQLGLLLQHFGAPFSEKEGERAAVYLTNALTGWEPPKGPKEHLGFPELEEERDAAEHVKRDTPILVILGNPPYNAFAGVSPKEEQGLVEPYKEGLIKEWGIKKFNLDDLYVRFFRLAERRIAETTGKGVVAFISNYSWLSDPSFVVLRKHLLESFDKFWIENLHGDRRISEYAPDGRTSETVFSISGFSPGIQQGVAISTWAKTGKKKSKVEVLFRNDLDDAKADQRRAHLLSTLIEKRLEASYEKSLPSVSNRHSFRPTQVTLAYLEWPLLTELCSVPPMNGLMEKRGGALIDIDRSRLEKRMRMYFDAGVRWEQLISLRTGLTEPAASFEPQTVRAKALKSEGFEASRILHYSVRPFESRWCYYSSVSGLWNRNRPTLWQQCWDGNSFLLSRVQASTSPEGPPFFFVKGLSDDHLLSPDAACFPLRLKTEEKKEASASQQALFDASANAPRANLSSSARIYLTKLGVNQIDTNLENSSLIWMHALAIGFSPAYLKENADGIRQDWPRIPLPKSADALERSAALGRKIASLLDTEADVRGVTSGTITPEMKHIGVIQSIKGKTLHAEKEDLALTAGWGHGGKDGVTMPGKGKITRRDYTKQELAAIESGAKARGLTLKQTLHHLGESTCDIYLNDVAYWSNIPEKVWDYTIGGYQVIKKWLSYREKELLGRSLTSDEAHEVMNMARRIAAIVFMEPALDQNYKKVKASTYKWASENV